MKTIINWYGKTMDMLYKLIRIVVAAALVVMVAVTAMEVVRRYVFGLSFIWAEELVRFLLVATTFIGGAAAYRAGGMAYLDLVTSRLNPKTQRVLSILTNIVVVAFCCYLAAQGYHYSFTPQIALMKSTGLKLQMSVIYLTIPIGITMLILFAVEKILHLMFPDETKREEASA